MDSQNKVIFLTFILCIPAKITGHNDEGSEQLSKSPLQDSQSRKGRVDSATMPCDKCPGWYAGPAWIENFVGRKLKCEHQLLQTTAARQPTAEDLSNLCESFQKLSIRNTKGQVKAAPVIPNPLRLRLNNFLVISSLKPRRIGFFDLPAECRNAIYELHLIEKGDLRLSCLERCNSLEPALLRTHPKIRLEVL